MSSSLYPSPVLGEPAPVQPAPVQPALVQPAQAVAVVAPPAAASVAQATNAAMAPTSSKAQVTGNFLFITEEGVGNFTSKQFDSEDLARKHAKIYSSAWVLYTKGSDSKLLNLSIPMLPV